MDNHVLQTFEEFREFKSRVRTPAIAAAVEENNAAVAADLLERVRAQEPAFLEHLVLKVLTAMGYGGAAGSAEQLGKSGDEGLDGVIRQDALGLTVSTSRQSATRPTGQSAARTSRGSSARSTGRMPTQTRLPTGSS
jgi:restriction system protein